MKQRLGWIDVAAVVADLRPSLASLRLQNVYDVNMRTLIFKFAKSDHKILLLVESGMRIHTTSYTRPTPPLPSAFVQKLRKFIRTRRLNNVKQVGTDRVIVFEFTGNYRLYFEFYASVCF